MLCAMHILDIGLLDCVHLWRGWLWQAIWAVLHSTASEQGFLQHLCDSQVFAVTHGGLRIQVSSYRHLMLGALVPLFGFICGLMPFQSLSHQLHLGNDKAYYEDRSQYGAALDDFPGDILFAGSGPHHCASAACFISPGLPCPGSQVLDWPGSNNVGRGWRPCPSHHLGGQSSYTEICGNQTQIRYKPVSGVFPTVEKG